MRKVIKQSGKLTGQYMCSGFLQVDKGYRQREYEVYEMYQGYNCSVAEWVRCRYLNVSYMLCARAIGSSHSRDKHFFIHNLFIFIYNLVALDSLGTFWASLRLHAP